MGELTKIEWCDHTFNPWIGCTKVSSGCVLCYAETVDKFRWGGKHWGKGRPRQYTSPAYWRVPWKWNETFVIDCPNCGSQETKSLLHIPDKWAVHVHTCGSGEESIAVRRVPRVFCGSLCDWLDEEVPAERLRDLLALIAATPNLDWLLLTKRPENFGKLITAAGRSCPLYCHGGGRAMAKAWLRGETPHNVWIGVSCENQEQWDKRIELARVIPAEVHFVSAEPLLDSIYVGSAFSESPVKWVIIGGESGYLARPCGQDWIRHLVQQCQGAQVPVFVKQLGAYSMRKHVGRDRFKHKKGGEPEEWDKDLQIRNFPPARVPEIYKL